ncbi:hypothetical protein IV203_025552 [Nitzschia inconspicua]|uniref:Uncharacterized protein n=1 Tax=Nitzschia inconspicua TaxID=303405 RepID=A0A9K3PWE7_9STRA|nr:hypothetical protein IV203_025552 [Nitzschia inconspicua]
MLKRWYSEHCMTGKKGKVIPNELQMILTSLQQRSENVTLLLVVVADFRNGKACALSTIFLDRHNEAMANPDGVATRTQEWNTFNRMLEAVVVDGFLDRCRPVATKTKFLCFQLEPFLSRQGKPGLRLGTNATSSRCIATR